MHISEGILSPEVCVAGFAGAALIGAAALNKIREEEIPLLSVMGACFFISSLIHFKFFFTSLHLTLGGLTAVVLGRRAFAPILVGLFFQALMFQHGGLSTLGINSVIIGLPALLTGWIFQKLASKLKPGTLAAAGGILTFLSVLASAALAMGVIMFSDKGLFNAAFAFSASFIVLGVLEGMVTALAVSLFLRIKPEMLFAGRKGEMSLQTGS